VPNSLPVERGLLGFLHPFSLGETLTTLFFHRGILEHNGVFHVTVSTHRGERNTVLVHIHTNDRVCIGFAGDTMSLVSDSHVKSPLVALVNDFGGADPSFFIVKSGSQPVEMSWTATKFAFDVGASCGSDTEPDRSIVFGKEPVAFAVVHHHWVRLIDVRAFVLV
jgi:hypothetical protein